jgi:hypothetical protein
VRVVREVEARLRVGGVAAGVEPERPNLPVGWDRADQEEDGHESGKEQPEA